MPDGHGTKRAPFLGWSTLKESEPLPQKKWEKGHHWAAKCRFDAQRPSSGAAPPALPLLATAAAGAERRLRERIFDAEMPFVRLGRAGASMEMFKTGILTLYT